MSESYPTLVVVKEKLTEATIGLIKVKKYRHKRLLMSLIAPQVAVKEMRSKSMKIRQRRD